MNNISGHRNRQVKWKEYPWAAGLVFKFLVWQRLPNTIMCMIDAMTVQFWLKGISWSTTKFKVQQIYTNQLLRAETCWSHGQSENSIPLMKLHHLLLCSWEVATGIILSQLIPFQTLHLFLLRSILISLLLIWMICPGLFILLTACTRTCKCLRSSLTFHNMLVDLQ